MISKQEVLEMVLSYHCADPRHAAALSLDALMAGGYMVISEADFIKSGLDIAKCTVEHFTNQTFTLGEIQ